MLLLGYLAKVQGLKGEFLLNPTTDTPERIPILEGLVLAPPGLDLSKCEPRLETKRVAIRTFRWHQSRPCLAFDQIPDRTAAEAFKSWTLWVPETSVELGEGDTYRHDWVGCQVFVGKALVGEILGLEPSPGGYDMVHMKDLRPGRHGIRNIPYIKAWFDLNLQGRRIDLYPPMGLLDVDYMEKD
jgi:16S rRNA processing protein RimM